MPKMYNMTSSPMRKVDTMPMAKAGKGSNTGGMEKGGMKMKKMMKKMK